MGGAQVEKTNEGKRYVRNEEAWVIFSLNFHSM